MKKPERLLVMRLSAMGDVAMTVPVLLALKRQFPEVVVISLSRKRFFPILQQVPDIILQEADVNDRHKGILGLRRLHKEIRSNHPTIIADLHNVLRTKILRAFLRKLPKAVINKGRKEKKKLVNDASFFKPLKSTLQRYQDVFHDLGFTVQSSSSDVLPSMDIPSKMHEIIKNHDCKWIGVAPFAAHEAKSLSLTKAKELVDVISGLQDVQVLLFGGGDKECRQLKIVAGTHHNVFNLAGIMSFDEELQVISNLDAMVSMDSGNGHLAAMYGVPVITLWGNTHPHAGFVPFNQPAQNQITASREQFPKIPTSIFGNKVPKGYEQVLETIDCNRVTSRLHAILHQTK
jgi:ADP-heptose:LPS heptosyltransferase